MIVSMRGVQGGADISTLVERDGFSIDASVGKRMDVASMKLFDPTFQITVPDRCEIWVYDTPASPVMVNGGFETLAGGWQSANVGTGTSNPSDTTNPRSGIYALKLTNPSTGNYGGVFQKQGVSVVAGQQLRVFAWVKGSAAGTTGPLRITLANPGTYVSPAGIASAQPSSQVGTWKYGQFKYGLVRYSQAVGAVVLTYDINPVVTTGYTLFSQTITVPVGYSWAFVEIYANSDGTVGTAYWDDLSFVTVVTDPPNAISAYNTYLNGKGNESTSGTPANWTPRLFAGFLATPAFTVPGAQRQIEITAQDYTVRLRTTICNKAFLAGQSDKAIVQSLFATYRPDYDVSGVQMTTASMPAISFPIHSLEQMMERVIKISRAYYRVDYYKRLIYGLMGASLAPFNISDQPVENIIPNASFESGTTGWTAYHDTIGTDTANAFVGTNELVCTNNDTSGVFGVFRDLTTAILPVSGTLVTLSFYFRSIYRARAYVSFGIGPDFAGQWVTGSLGAWTRASITLPVPFGPLNCQVFLQFENPDGLNNGKLGYADASLFEIAAGPNPAWADGPPNLPTYGSEDIIFSPDGAGLANKVWIVGSTFVSGVQTYQVPVVLVNGANYQFQLPGNPDAGGMVIKVNGVDQGVIGVAPSDGDTTNPSSFKYNVLISHIPAAVAFKTAPPNGATVLVTGRFRYPLVSAVSAPAAIAAANGEVFETVIRDRRIQDLALAQSVGNAFLQNQGTTFKGGSFKVKTRGYGGNLLQPGQQITIRNNDLFQGLLPGGSVTLTALVTRLRTTLENDANQPYVIEVAFAEKMVGMS